MMPLSRHVGFLDRMADRLEIREWMTREEKRHILIGHVLQTVGAVGVAIGLLLLLGTSFILIHGYLWGKWLLLALMILVPSFVIGTLGTVMILCGTWRDW